MCFFSFDSSLIWSDFDMGQSRHIQKGHETLKQKRSRKVRTAPTLNSEHDHESTRAPHENMMSLEPDPFSHRCNESVLFEAQPDLSLPTSPISPLALAEFM